MFDQDRFHFAHSTDGDRLADTGAHLVVWSAFGVLVGERNRSASKIAWSEAIMPSTWRGLLDIRTVLRFWYLTRRQRVQLVQPQQGELSGLLKKMRRTKMLCPN